MQNPVQKTQNQEQVSNVAQKENNEQVNSNDSLEYQELTIQTDQARENEITNQAGKEQEKKEQYHEQTSFEDVMKQGIDMKGQGNRLFKEKNFAEATKCYNEALRILAPKNFRGAPRPVLQKMGEIRSNIFYNIGVCYFNGYDMAQAELFFNEAITLNPAYVKALHQRATARFEMGRVDESFSDIKQAFSLDSSSADIHASYSKILEACSKNTKEQKMNQASEQKINEPPKQNKKEQQMEKKPQNISKKNKQNRLWDFVPPFLVIGTIAYVTYKWFKE